jgi:hypothetical protein
MGAAEDDNMMPSGRRRLTYGLVLVAVAACGGGKCPVGWMDGSRGVCSGLCY